VHAGGQQLRQHKPFAYQEVNGTRQEVASRFVLEGQQVRFAVGAYEAGRPLVVDPVLSYSTYLGGRFADRGWAITVDPATGDAVVTGETYSTDFPTVNAFQPICGCRQNVADAFVTRLRADGTALVYSTFLGGSSSDQSFAIALDPVTGDALLTGWTSSTNFPTVNPLQGTNPVIIDAFVARLSADGSDLRFSTYLGGSGNDYGSGIAVDPTTGNALVTGYTASTNFPTANPLQASHGGGVWDVFVARLSADGSALVYSTYLGGSVSDYGSGIAVEPTTGDVLITGLTSSTNFPTVNPLQASHGGGVWDVFGARLSADGSALLYSTYLGGGGSDQGNGIAVDPTTGDVLIAGSTASTNFPTVNPLQPNYGGGLVDAFVARLSANGSILVFSTYLGGSSGELAAEIAVDPTTGDVLLTGGTLSTHFPTPNPFQPNH